MTIRGRHRLAASMLLAAMGTACGGGAGINSTARQSTARRGAARATVSTSVSVSTPTPTTTPTTTPTATPTTTPTTGTKTGALSAPKLIDRGDDYIEIARSLLLSHEWVAPIKLAVISTRQNVVSLQLTSSEPYVVSIARWNAASPWRLNLVARLPPDTEVSLGGGSAASDSDADGSGELHGGTFGVGVEVDTQGSPVITRDAGDRSLPRLIHYVSTPLLPNAHTPGSLENLCNASGAGGRPAGVVFGWLYRVIAYTPDGRIVSDVHVCVPFPDQNDRSDPPPPPILPEPPTIGEVWRAIQLPIPVVGANPVSRGVTGLTTRLWSGGAQTAQVAATIDGFVITGTARVIEYRFATDEGYLGAGGPGSARVPAFTHDFETKGAHSLLVASVWRATVTMTGPGFAVAIPIDINVAVLTATADYPVTEVRSRLVG